MSKAVTKTREERLEMALTNVKDWKAGKTQLRTWELGAAGNRRMTYQSYEKYKQD